MLIRVPPAVPVSTGPSPALHETLVSLGGSLVTALLVRQPLRVSSADEGTGARQLSRAPEYDARRLHVALFNRLGKVVSSLPPDGLEAGLRSLTEFLFTLVDRRYECAVVPKPPMNRLSAHVDVLGHSGDG